MDGKRRFNRLLAGIITLAAIVVLCLQIGLISSKRIYDTLAVFDNLFWVIFFFEYLLELALSENKAEFVKENIINVIAIIPENIFVFFLMVSGMQYYISGLKIVQLSKLIRIILYILKFRSEVHNVIKITLLDYAIAGTATTMVIGAVGMSITEDMSFADALWWSFVTATTVGYGDITPTTIIGKCIAAVLMINSVIFISMLTATIATYFTTKDEYIEKNYENRAVYQIVESLKNFDNLSEDDIDKIYYVLKSLKKHNNKNK